MVDKPMPKVGAMINFDFNSSVIRPESYTLLDEFGKAFSGGLKDAVFIVAGHADSIGSDKFNFQLSLLRAKSVTNYIIRKFKVDPGRLIVEGKGRVSP